MKAEREPEGDDEPQVEKQGRNEPVHPERDRQAGHQRDRESSEHQPAPGVPADAKPQRGQPCADQREDGDARHAVPVAASRVSQPRKQHAEQRAEKILLVSDRPEDDQRHQRDVQEHHRSRPVEPRGVELEYLRQPAHELPPVNRLSFSSACTCHGRPARLNRQVCRFGLAFSDSTGIAAKRPAGPDQRQRIHRSYGRTSHHRTSIFRAGLTGQGQKTRLPEPGRAL